MKKIFRGLIFIPILTLAGCSHISRFSKEIPEPIKEEKNLIHIETSTTDG